MHYSSSGQRVISRVLTTDDTERRNNMSLMQCGFVSKRAAEVAVKIFPLVVYFTVLMSVLMVGVYS